MKVIGDLELGQQVIDILEQWDSVICRLEIDEIIKLCNTDFTLFDVSSESKGVKTYEENWNRHRPYMRDGMTVQRHDVTIHVNENLAFIHGYVKLNHADIEKISNLRWCRSTVCLRKEKNVWVMAHQHISVPVQLETQQMKQPNLPV